MSTVPYYLRPTTTEKTPGEIDLSWSFDYEYPPETVYNSTSFWTDLSSKGKGFVDGAIDVVSYVPKKAYETIGGAVETLQSKVSGGIFDFLDSALIRVVLVFAVLIIGFVMLAKYNVLGQIGEALK